MTWTWWDISSYYPRKWVESEAIIFLETTSREIYFDTASHVKLYVSNEVDLVVSQP